MVSAQAGLAEKQMAALLRSKRPLGRKQLTPTVVGWLRREMRWLAQNYILLCEQESLGYVTPGEERELVRVAHAQFGLERLQEHLSQRLVAAPPRDDLKLARLGASHAPTVRAIFQACIEDWLRDRSGAPPRGSGAQGEAWRRDLEWTVMLQISAMDSIAGRTFDPAAFEPAAVGQQRRPDDAAPAPAPAAGGERRAKRAPKPNKKQPLGKKEVGAATLQWLGRATERAAVEYMSLLQELSRATECAAAAATAAAAAACSRPPPSASTRQRPPCHAIPVTPALPRPPFHAAPFTPSLPRPPSHARPATPAQSRPPCHALHLARPP